MAQDIILDENNELRFYNGDLMVGYSDEQHIQHHLQINPGQLYSNPFTGVGIDGYLNGPVNTAILARAIRESLVDDGFLVRDIKVTGNGDDLKIKINAVKK
jgi:hypothetical protein